MIKISIGNPPIGENIGPSLHEPDTNLPMVVLRQKLTWRLVSWTSALPSKANSERKSHQVQKRAMSRICSL